MGQLLAKLMTKLYLCRMKSGKLLFIMYSSLLSEEREGQIN